MLDRLPYRIVDDARTTQGVVAAAERLASADGCRVVAVDHLHLIDAGDGRRGDNRHNEVTRISAALKDAFKRLGVCGLVAAQLNRGQSAGERPRLSDLRESGSLEEHADVVAMLHRDDYHHRGDPSYQPTNDCDVLILKNRSGPTGGLKFGFDRPTQTFADPAAAAQASTVEDL